LIVNRAAYRLKADLIQQVLTALRAVLETNEQTSTRNVNV